MSKIWLIEHHFARGDFYFCQKIIQDAFKDDAKHEYSNHIQGRIHLAEGNVAAALKHFQLSYSVNPNNPDTLQHIAKCLIIQCRYKKAAEALTAARKLTKSPDFTIHHDLARCYIQLKDYPLAEEHCKEAGKICKTKDVYKLLATCLIQQNKIGEAIEMFRLALRMYPKSSQLYTTFGKLCSQMNFEDEALKAFQAAVKLDESNVTATFELAAIHQKRNELEEAIPLYRKALLINPNSAVSYSNLGLCYYHKNKVVAALTCLQKARELNPTSSQVLFNLGLVYASLRQYCSAITYWKSADAMEKSEPSPFVTAVSEKLIDSTDA